MLLKSLEKVEVEGIEEGTFFSAITLVTGIWLFSYVDITL